MGNAGIPHSAENQGKYSTKHPVRDRTQPAQGWAGAVLTWKMWIDFPSWAANPAFHFFGRPCFPNLGPLKSPCPLWNELFVQQNLRGKGKIVILNDSLLTSSHIIKFARGNDPPARKREGVLLLKCSLELPGPFLTHFSAPHLLSRPDRSVSTKINCISPRRGNRLRPHGHSHRR